MDKDQAKRNYQTAVATLDEAFAEDADDPRNDREYSIEMAQLDVRRAKDQLASVGLTIDGRGDVVPA